MEERGREGYSREGGGSPGLTRDNPGEGGGYPPPFVPLCLGTKGG